ncbi:MAG: flavin-dependent oxidoreductase, partial [Rhodobiaceae bacterium]|nr:flavin-dependent oxidoreductase [Rhodobiaceae bacterium]
AAAEIRPLGVGINLLPHASKTLCGLRLEDGLRERAVETRENLFYTRHGQRIFGEPCGRHAGFDWPQFSIHRGDLHLLLLETARQRLGDDRVLLGHRCTGLDQDGGAVTARFARDSGSGTADSARGDILIGCDGFHSAVRKQFYPDEPAAVYGGINLWRGVTRAEPFLTGASVARAGSLKTGKFLIYPIRNDIDGAGRQLINWAAEIESDTRAPNDWNTPGRMEDFFHLFEDWHFDWLDIPALIRNADMILEYPMVDRDPLPRWTFGRATLLGDAAHPMYPRGSNGAGQAILDARALSDALAANADVEAALAAYDGVRVGATAEVVRTNRTTPPDAILKEVCERTGDKPFARIEDVISADEMAAITNRYKKVAGYDRQSLAAKTAAG